MPEEPRIARPLPPMPTPEQLGIALAKPVDWSQLRVRLDRVGASGFQLTSESGGWRFTCHLTNGRTVEGRADNDVEAVLNALRQVE